MTHRAALRAFAFSGFLLALAPSAFAAEPAEVAERLKALFAEQMIGIGWTGIAGDSGNIVLQGLSAGALGQPAKVTLGDVSLSGVTENNGEVVVAKATVPPYSFSEAGSALSMSGIEFTNLRLPAKDATGALAHLVLYDSAELKNLAVAVEGKQVFATDDVHVEMGLPKDENSPFDFDLKAEKFTADLTGAKDPQAKAVIEAMGYQTLTGSLAVNGSWVPKDGRLTIDQYDIAVDNAGTLGMTFDIGGYTPEFIQSLREMQKKMAENPNQDQSAQGLAMLGLMQQITFHGATIRFDDKSLTGKVLDQVAKQQGVKPADIVNQVKALLPFGLAQLNNPELSASVSAAVGKFLDNPQSIEIRAAPAQPVPVAQIVAVGSTAPLTLPQVLGLGVTANEP